MAPLPCSDMGQFLPYILVLLQDSTWGCCPPKPIPLLGHAPSPTPHPSDWPRLPLSQTFTCINTLAISYQLFLFTWSRTTEQSVMKCRHVKFWHRGITQKTEYNIHNMAQIWNQEFHFHAHISLPKAPNFSQINPMHVYPTMSLINHINIIFLSNLSLPFILSTKNFMCTSHFSHSCYMSSFYFSSFSPSTSSQWYQRSTWSWKMKEN